ncbi:ABC transporter ATP-binding protein [Tenacibaculum litopenaei]
MNKMSTAVVNAIDLTIGYRSKKQVHKVASELNFSLGSGQFIVLLGKNGIGKSTLLRTLSKVQAPLQGTVQLKGKPLEAIHDQELATMLSLVLTERLPPSQLTVFELVALGRQPYTNWLDNLNNEHLKKILWALEKTEISQLKNKRFYELSDGQLQRVLIARALAQDTELIILDEPTAHLDIHHTYKVFSLLKDLVKTTNKTILISTHEVNLAIQLADSCLLLTEGGQLHSGTAKQLIETNAFDSLFPKDLISFNKTLEQFVIKKT